jgi:hypothetical protein
VRPHCLQYHPQLARHPALLLLLLLLLLLCLQTKQHHQGRQHPQKLWWL